MTRLLTIARLALLTFATVVGCGPENGSGPTLDATAEWTAKLDLGADDGVVIDAGGPQTSEQARGGAPDSVTIENGTVVIRSLRFASAADNIDTNITADDKSRDQNDELIRFQGPYVCTATEPLSLGAHSVAGGQFERVVFVIEPATSASQLGGRDDMVGRSIVVSGQVWRDGRAARFVFTSDYATECSMSRPVTLSAGQSCTGTLTFRTSRWFRSGSSWLDPNEPGNRGALLRNIRQNVTALTAVE